MFEDLDLGSIARAVGGFLDEYGLPVGMGLQAASVLARQKAERRAGEQAASNRAALAQAELARQRSIAEAARQSFEQTMPMFTPESMDSRRRTVEERIAALNAPPADPSAVVQNYQQARSPAPKVVGDTIAARAGEGLSTAAQDARNSALLKSFGYLNADNATALRRSAADQASAGAQARRSAAILPHEIATSDAKAEASAGPARTASTVLGGLGNIAALYGITAGRRKRPAAGDGMPPGWGGVGATPY